MVKPQSSSSSSSSCCDNKVNVIRNKGVVVQLQGGWGEEKDKNNNNASTFTYFSSSKHATPHSYSHPHPHPHPHPEWTSSIIPRKPGPKRCGKNSKLRWNNHNHNHNHNGNVRPTTTTAAAADLCNKGLTFTQDEEDLIIKLHAAVGSRWGLIAHQLAGRTENDIKNHWNTKLRKKLSEMGIDPITHKPFSQILADYGNIGGIISTTTSSSDSDSPNINNNNNKYIIGTITTTRDLKKVVVKPADSSISTIITSTSSSSSPSSTFHSNSQLLSHTMSMSMSSLQNTYNNTTTTHSLDLLSQLQAISLVAQPPYSNSNSNSNLPSSSYYNTTTDDDFFPLPPPLKTSSISSTSANNPNSPDPGFSWHDFLLEVADEQEPFKPPQNHHPPVPVPVPDQDQLLAMEFSLTNHDYYDFQAHPTSSTLLTTPDAKSSSLFMEAMLHQEDDMFLTFPGLMEEHLY